jgi:hypothetical protein
MLLAVRTEIASNKVDCKTYFYCPLGEAFIGLSPRARDSERTDENNAQAVTR